MSDVKPLEEILENAADVLVVADGPSKERITLGLTKAAMFIQERAPLGTGVLASTHFVEAVQVAGAEVLSGITPQRIEDCFVARTPSSPLSETLLRRAWLVFSDELDRTGDRPEFGGAGLAETWAFTALSQPWPFVGRQSQIDTVASLCGSGQQVVVVRGPGRTAFLAALRRHLASNRPEVVMPPATGAATDTWTGVIPNRVDGASLPEDIQEPLKRIEFGEDYIGLLGRLGAHKPVALLLDDAHLQSRSVLLGLPVFLEPAVDRDALLVCAGPSEPRFDGPLSELIADAAERGLLTEIELSGLDSGFAAALLKEGLGLDAPEECAGLLADVCAPHASEAGRIGAAHAWLAAIAEGGTDNAAKTLREPLPLSEWAPTHPTAIATLSVAAIEGRRFHGFSVGQVMEKSEDEVEDLLHDADLEIDGRLVGACEAAVPSTETLWSDLPDGLHPVFQFRDERYRLALLETMDDERQMTVAAAHFDALVRGYGFQKMWVVADRLWHFARLAGKEIQLQRMIVGRPEPERIDAAFRRLLPVLEGETVYRLAMARLYGAAMELGVVSTGGGNPQLADQAYQSAAAAAQRLGRVGAAGEAMARLGEIRLALALPKPARSAFELADKLLQSEGYQASRARMGLLQAECYVLEGDLPGAVSLLESVIERLVETKDQGHSSLGLMRLGRLLYELGRRDEAVERLDAAIIAADGSGDPRPSGASRIARAFIDAEENELQAAFAHLNLAASAFRQAGLPIAILETAAADLERRGGRAAEAETRFRAVATGFKQANAAMQWADAEHGLARCLIDQENYTDALESLAEVGALRVRARDRFGLVRVLMDQGLAYEGQGSTPKAYRSYSEGLVLAERSGLSGHATRFYECLEALRPLFDALPDEDPDQIRKEAAAAADVLEATWNAPPQPAKQSTEVH